MRKMVILTLLAVCTVAVVAVWPLHCPIEMKAVCVEPSGIMDDNGRESLLATFRIRNRSFRPLDFANEAKSSEARIAGQWVNIEQVWNLTHLEGRGKREIALILPADSGACRLHVKYQPEPLNWRLWWALERLPCRTLRFVWWLRPSFQRSADWTLITAEALLPGKPTAAAEGLDGGA